MYGADRIVGVHEGARQLWPHNETVMAFDPLLDAAVQRALSNIAQPVFEPGEPAGYAEAMPYVRLLFVKPDAAPMAFLDALDAEQLPNIHGPCDRCSANDQPVARLWLRAGGSIVQVECCFDCHQALPGLVWR